MVDRNTQICACNNLNAGEIARCIRENNFSTLQELLENDVCPMADKCESCKDEGYNNDGVNIPMVLSMVKRGEL